MTTHLLCAQSPEHDAGITRAKTYVAGSDKHILAGFFVSSVNEWKMKQERVLVLTPSSYYRVAYDHKTGKIDHYHKSPLEELRVIEKTLTSMKVYTRTQVSPLLMRAGCMKRHSVLLNRLVLLVDRMEIALLASG